MVQSHLQSEKNLGSNHRALYFLLSDCKILKLVSCLFFSVMALNSIIYPARIDQNYFLPVPVKLSLKLVSLPDHFPSICNVQHYNIFSHLFLLFFCLFIYSVLVVIPSNANKTSRRNLVDKGFKKQLNSDPSHLGNYY